MRTQRNRPTTRIRRSILPDLLRRPLCRLLFVGLLALSQLPAAATVALALFDAGSEHQLLVSSGCGRTKITLHHSEAPACVHHHTALENVLLSGSDGDHPDHEFAFGCGETADGTKPKADGTEAPEHESIGTSGAIPAMGTQTPSAADAGPHTGTPVQTAEPPMALRRGTVLLV
ncbi:MAG: hypothetical protein H7A49_09395 [Akkermansiaceae bacterium]|nr:hypothetical protein [Akkermansiaceae bacterium]MCP5544107.1 hypothetical protein [Akkermansiaceae bacterium]MCP5547837.1 hypothetical protein [Akkermansiaceae bacterium]